MRTGSVIGSAVLLAANSIVVLAVVVLVAAASMGITFYSYSKRALHEQATKVERAGGVGASELVFDFLHRFDQIALVITAAAAVGGASPDATRQCRGTDASGHASP